MRMVLKPQGEGKANPTSTGNADCQIGAPSASTTRAPLPASAPPPNATVIDHYQLEEVSLGDFVLTGGEIAAQAMIDATVRLLPDILGNEASIAEESHMAGLLEHPHYTRPALWNGRSIPDVLQSGHHINIAKWRQEMSQQVTKEKRPDLWAAFQNALGKPDPKD